MTASESSGPLEPLEKAASQPPVGGLRLSAEGGLEPARSLAHRRRSSITIFHDTALDLTQYV